MTQDWKELYRQKVIPVEDIVKVIPPHSHCSLSDGAADPRAITREIEKRYAEFTDVSFMQGPPGERIDMFDPQMKGHIRYEPFVGPVGQYKDYWEGVRTGVSDYLPSYFSSIERLMRDGHYPIDVAIVSLSTPNDQGYCTLGVSCSYQRAAMQAAKIVIAEVNKQMPRMFGETSVHVSELDHIIEADEPLPVIPDAPIGDAERQIGEFCASLIEDGSTIQAGIGKLPNAALDALVGKKDLGVHSELFTTKMMDLAEKGVITASKKTLHNGINIATVLEGTKELYDWSNDNPFVQLFPVGYVNNPMVIAQNDKLVSINSCIEVDLFGQVAAESFGHKQATGAGGQVDFVRGATMSRGGKSIIVINSTAARGTVSKIRVFLTPGSLVTTPRNETQFIVTEYGIADLRGKTNKERAKALINIAHPDFRESLVEEFMNYFGFDPLR
ncbi:acetyl-CoA hydrolase/transferase family protein [Anaerotardibacter muris]|uniref:acetyl-CoA hydrolase/transferase family protein n=1 Tax=Anaerotardibacter muris TaxID=2941505 RepID=UPI00203CAA43|nr:acetyl-CoA hydrolase/transferase C-terminal domain-containing protein [Anaerotardibacter muris]